jgi:hypothetical protein
MQIVQFIKRADTKSNTGWEKSQRASGKLFCNKELPRGNIICRKKPTDPVKRSIYEHLQEQISKKSAYHSTVTLISQKNKTEKDVSNSDQITKSIVSRDWSGCIKQLTLYGINIITELD